MAVDNSKIQTIILKAVADSGFFRNGAVFKGGGVLRHIYASPRYSADLDFSWPSCRLEDLRRGTDRAAGLIKKMHGREFAVDKVYRTAHHFARAILSEKHPDGSKNNIFLEIDNFPNPEPETYVLSVPGNPILRVRTLRQMVNDKFLALLLRRRPKGHDFFDVNFLKYRDIDAAAVDRQLEDYERQGMTVDLDRNHRTLRNGLRDPVIREDITRDILNYLPPEETAGWDDRIIADMIKRTIEWIGWNIKKLDGKE
jgi:predicted nucleotidyltransferase component of viral defense system